MNFKYPGLRDGFQPSLTLGYLTSAFQAVNPGSPVPIAPSVIGYWLLAIGYWLLAIGYYALGSSHVSAGPRIYPDQFALFYK